MDRWIERRMADIETKKRKGLRQDDLLLAPRDPRSELTVVCDPAGYDWSTDTRPVPKIIHQVWVGPREPPSDTLKMKSYAAKIGWDYRLWRESDIDSLELGQETLSTLHYNLRRTCWRGASNIMRYAAILKHGGVYLDCDWILRDETRDISDVLPLTGLSAVPEWGSRQVGVGALFLENSVIACPPYNSIIKRCLDSVHRNNVAIHKTWLQGNSVSTTGPFLFNRCLYGSFHIISPHTWNEWFGRVNHNV